MAFRAYTLCVKRVWACIQTSTKTGPNNIMAIFIAAKMKISDEKKVIFFVILARNRDCGYSLEPPHRGGSNGCPQSMFYSRNKKKNVYPSYPIFSI